MRFGRCDRHGLRKHVSKVDDSPRNLPVGRYAKWLSLAFSVAARASRGFWSWPERLAVTALGDNARVIVCDVSQALLRAAPLTHPCESLPVADHWAGPD